MSYENFLIREMNGEAEYQRGDTNCPDCGQLYCACESLADWHREVDSGSDVCVPAEPEVHQSLQDNQPTSERGLCSHSRNSSRDTANETVGRVSELITRKSDAEVGDTDSGSILTSFSQWLEAHGDSLPVPQSFSEWLNQSGDKI